MDSEKDPSVNEAQVDYDRKPIPCNQLVKQH